MSAPSKAVVDRSNILKTSLKFTILRQVQPHHSGFIIQTSPSGGILNLVCTKRKIMSHKFKDELLECFNQVYDKAKECRLDPEIFVKLEPKLVVIGEKLELTAAQAFFFSVLLALDLDEDGVTYNELSGYLGCNTLELLNYSAALLELEERELLSLIHI